MFPCLKHDSHQVSTSVTELVASTHSWRHCRHCDCSNVIHVENTVAHFNQNVVVLLLATPISTTPFTRFQAVSNPLRFCVLVPPPLLGKLDSVLQKAIQISLHMLISLNSLPHNVHYSQRGRALTERTVLSVWNLLVVITIVSKWSWICVTSNIVCFILQC